MSEVSVGLIVAMAENRVIGRNNQLPWYLPDDLKYFKSVTMGKPIIMGRKTYQSIGKPLPGRVNIVVSRNLEFSAAGVLVARSAKEALALAKRAALEEGKSEVMIIGGAQLYGELLPSADKLYLTEVHAQVEGDAQFPELNFSLWEEASRKRFHAVNHKTYEFSFVVYRRIKESLHS